MTLAAMRERLRVLLSIEFSQVAAVDPSFDETEWLAFRADPARYFVSCDAPFSEAIWQVLLGAPVKITAAEHAYLGKPKFRVVK
ncbi:MAG: hypothetical protein JWL84_3696 [Rhodospirillales bacterium]|jgi:hypothetical protein|nr:hypothetical protein [Rhodospirillales bacterium]